MHQVEENAAERLAAFRYGRSAYVQSPGSMRKDQQNGYFTGPGKTDTKANLPVNTNSVLNSFTSLFLLAQDTFSNCFIWWKISWKLINKKSFVG